MDTSHADNALAAFEQHRRRLAFVVSRHMNPLMSTRVSVDDVIQETYLAASRRLEFLSREPEIPLYFKFRKIALQTLADLEREHIRSEKRSMTKEVSGETSDRALASIHGEIRSPKSILAKKERATLIRRMIEALPETDRQIITLRNFDALSNQDCAAILGIDQKASSIRYVRALKRLRERLQSLSEFTP